MVCQRERAATRTAKLAALPASHRRIDRWIVSPAGEIKPAEWVFAWRRCPMLAPIDGAPREWFAVQVWSGREPQTARHLSERGYEVFLPRYRERRIWSDRIRVVERALFAGYVFCRLSTQIFGKVATAPGVLQIVGDGSGPAPIAAHEIAALQQIDAARLAAEPWPMPQVGQRLRIDFGPLKGVEGVALEVKNRRRLVVSVSLLQRAVAVELDASWVTSRDQVWR
jgi:transcription antitermination factor NusG